MFDTSVRVWDCSVLEYAAFGLVRSSGLWVPAISGRVAPCLLSGCAGRAWGAGEEDCGEEWRRRGWEGGGKG